MATFAGVELKRDETGALSAELPYVTTTATCFRDSERYVTGLSGNKWSV
jgi:hypothetical protein